MSGSAVFENWKAHLNGVETDVIFEFPAYSDTDGVAEVRSDFGPYEVLSAMREIPALTDCPSVILRIRRHVWPSGDHAAGDIPSELVALLSLLSGTRLASATNYSRRFGFNGDPLGEPIHSHQAVVVPKPIMTAPVLPHVLKRRIHDLTLIKRFIELSEEQSVMVAKASRLYQQALWYAEAQPEFCWLMLVSAVEVAAGAWRKGRLPPEDQLRELRPKVADMLLAAGGQDLLTGVAKEFADYMGATRKFVQFLTRFSDPADQDERWEKSLKFIYGARSKALHSGAAIPQVMPLALERFERIVQASLVRWWKELPGASSV